MHNLKSVAALEFRFDILVLKLIGDIMNVSIISILVLGSRNEHFVINSQRFSELYRITVFCKV